MFVFLVVVCVVSVCGWVCVGCGCVCVVCVCVRGMCVFVCVPVFVCVV